MPCGCLCPLGPAMTPDLEFCRGSLIIPNTAKSAGQYTASDEFHLLDKQLDLVIVSL
jgi:hypothetical protein